MECLTEDFFSHIVLLFGGDLSNIIKVVTNPTLLYMASHVWVSIVMSFAAGLCGCNWYLTV